MSYSSPIGVRQTGDERGIYNCGYRQVKKRLFLERLSHAARIGRVPHLDRLFGSHHLRLAMEVATRGIVELFAIENHSHYLLRHALAGFGVLGAQRRAGVNASPSQAASSADDDSRRGGQDGLL